MAVVNGHGGYLSLFFDEDQVNAVTVDLDTWTGNWQCEYVPVTPAGSGAGRLYLPVIGTHSWLATFPLEATDAPDILGLEPGAPVYEAYFRRGNETRTVAMTTSDVFDLLERTTITSVTMVDDNKGDALRVVVTGTGGRLTQGYEAT